MEIDPAALSRSTTNPGAFATPPAPSSSALPNAKDAQKTTKSAPGVPRVDLEPFYAEIKAGCGDSWAAYKEGVSQFILGYRNQTELNVLIEPFILNDPHREHLHNQLICGIFANLGRDSPDGGVASWVAANDKPSTVPKQNAGDAAEQRLKTEIMQLPPRMRFRIKSIRDEPHKPLTHTLMSNATALTIQHPQGRTSSAIVSAADVSAQAPGLNRDLEVRRRYNQPLISEAHDLPNQTSLNDRIIPICYEEGLSSGVSNAGSCSSLVSIAMNVFVKDMLTTIISRTRCDPPISGPRLDQSAINASEVSRGDQSGMDAFGTGLDRSGMGIMTAKYRAKLKEEEQRWKDGDIKRSDAGLLPVEEHTLRQLGKGRGVPGDLRLAWELENHWLKLLGPWQGERLVLDGFSTHGYGHGDGTSPVEENGDGRRPQPTRSKSSQAGLALINGVNGAHDSLNNDAMDVDEPQREWSWPGSMKADRKALSSLLDDCLNID